MMAKITARGLSSEEMQSFFSSMQAAYRPTISCLVTLSEA
jgi:hypothetical protein